MFTDRAYNYRVVSGKIATAGIPKPGYLAVLGDDGIEVVMNLMPDDSEYTIDDERRIIQPGILSWTAWSAQHYTSHRPRSLSRISSRCWISSRKYSMRAARVSASSRGSWP